MWYRAQEMYYKRVVPCLSLTAFVFGLIVFLYVVALSFFAPYWLDKQVTHLQEEGELLHPLLWWLRNDVMGILCLFGSALGFFIWRLTAGR
ncbi:MAG: hypothetical protein SVY53_01445 [Chloroflexota bacterium]|nr:hypothetical protein [Chloroflexota bacterium]